MNPFARAAAAALLLAAALPAVAAEAARQADGIAYYVGIDTRLVVPSGTYAGLANPNAGRLTLLYDHGDHFHGIGAYSLSGPAAAPTVLNTNTNNRLPEPYTRVSPETSAIGLLPGSGAFAGRWVSGVLPAGAPAAEYSLLGIASVQSLDDRSAAADLLFHSSANRWSAHFFGVNVGLRLLDISPGLQVAAGGVMDIFDGGNTFALGDSGSFEFMPTFHVAQGAAAGVYSASFMLVNLSPATNRNVFDGGVFHIDLAVPVSEPHPAALLLAGAADRRGAGAQSAVRRHVAQRPV